MGTVLYREPIHIVAAKRTPIGRFGGTLRDVRAVELAKYVSEEIVGTLRQQVDSVIFGNVLQAGVGMNLARQVALELELSKQIAGFTVNMVCGSGLQAVSLAASEIEQGESKLVLAGGAESMSQAPYYDKTLRWGKKYGHSSMVDAILADGLTDPVLNIEMGETAERVAEIYDISREEQDLFAFSSQQKAVAAADAFEREIVPYTAGKEVFSRDEYPRADTTIEKLARLRPAFRGNGTVTAGNASGLNDGASALLIGSKEVIDTYGLQSRARIVASSRVGCEPATMGLGPVGAIRSLCEATGWDLGDIPAIELNEAFAAQSIACIRELGLRDEQVNQRGGAIALGHPLGSSGARVLVTLLHILEDNGWERGIASLCIGGGMGIAMAIER
jgi:acetyl-CoA C-acetyltransferase